VVVFKRPPGVPGTIDDLIKRVVAVEGERISIREGKVWVDDRPLTEPYVGDQETFANVGCGSGDTTGIDTIEGFVVPDDHIFVLGDNRGDSSDGRCFGPVHNDLLVGRAFLVLWPPSKIGGL
jgi:signal peptidase I